MDLIARGFGCGGVSARNLVMIAVSIGNGSGDAQGSERALEYDTMTGLYAEFVENEVLPKVEAQAHVKLSKRGTSMRQYCPATTLTCLVSLRCLSVSCLGVDTSGVVPHTLLTHA